MSDFQDHSSWGILLGAVVQLVAESGLQKPSVLELMVLLVVAAEPHAPSTW